MTEEQLQAIKDIAEAAAWVASGAATHQPRSRGIMEDAMIRARVAFDLPPFVDEDLEDNR